MEPHYDELPALISVTRAAELIGISRSSAYILAKAGELPSRRLGGRVFVITSRIHDFIHGTNAQHRDGAA
ncbi:MAG: helix-turn-helix transcriptional regulator [Nocardioides sp.]